MANFTAVEVARVFSALVIGLVVYSLYLAVKWFMKMRTISKAVDQLPGPKRHWLFGNTHQFPGPNDAGLKWIIQQITKNKTCVRMWFGPFHCTVFAGHPKVVKRIFLSSEPARTTEFRNTAAPWIGEGLLLSVGEKWFRNRKLLTPAFHFNILRSYVGIYNEATDVFLNKLETASELGGSVEISHPLCLLSLNIILRCAFSNDIDVQGLGTTLPYVSAMIKISRLLIERFFNPVLKPDFIFYALPKGRLFRKCVDIAHRTSEKIIAERKLALKENPDEARKAHVDFLDILLLARDENGRGLTDQEIRDEVDTFLFAGHDTASTAIMWALYDLARFPHHQHKCREEVDQFLGNRVAKNFEWGDFAAIPFTTQCIKETLRLHSPVAVAGRELTSEFELKGVKLPPGTELNVALFACHHHEEVWGPDHEEFKPERFHPDKIEERDPFAFLPFGAGSRNCIGQNFAMNEIKVVVCKVLHRFLLTVDPSHPVGHELELVNRAANGIKLFLESRV